MSGAWSSRHSATDRPPTKPASPTYKESGHLSRTRIDERQQEISDREAERLAEKIVAVGADYMDVKSRERYGDEWQADDNAAPTMEAEPMANKLMKEAAREMARAAAKHNAGQVFPGSDAAKAEAVYAQRNSPGSPLYEVAEKVREKLAAAEERAVHPHEFLGVNPEGERTPDVMKGE
ncbi:hypothetical protein D9Q98_005115 [Chlorella vulgaris]|uniref:Uncharacterized protein n=1 Tax=Chlorella vulgaris TaxID=3077 RepID=A0A9D4TNI2_CHLVU|nr:hypothetical protein D9Q98_005115 [Chlorella vulgaris]